MCSCPLFRKPMHLGVATLVFALFKLLKMYSVCRQRHMMKKELAGDKHLHHAKKDDETHKKTMAFLKPFTGSASYAKALEHGRELLLFDLVFEAFVLFVSVMYTGGKAYLKFWRFAGKMFKHPCHHSHVFFYLLLRFGFALAVRLPFYYYKTFLLDKKHGHPVKSRCKFFRVHLLHTLKMVLLTSLFVSGLSYLLSLSKTDFHVNAFFFVLGFGLLLVSVLPFYHKLVFTLKPLEDPELKKDVDALGKKFGLSAKNVKVYSTADAGVMYSMAYGFGKNTLLYMNESYVNQGKAAFVPMLLHLLGRVKNHQFLKFFVLKVTKFLLFTFLYFHLKGHTHLLKSFGLSKSSPHVLKMEAVLAYTCLFFMLFDVFLRGLSHPWQLHADNFAVKSGHGEDMMNLWLNVYMEKKWFVHVDKLWWMLNAATPSLYCRVYKYFEAVGP